MSTRSRRKKILKPSSQEEKKYRKPETPGLSLKRKRVVVTLMKPKMVCHFVTIYICSIVLLLLYMYSSSSIEKINMSFNKKKIIIIIKIKDNNNNRSTNKKKYIYI